MTSQQRFKNDFLSSFKLTGSADRYITAWQFQTEYGIEPRHVKELMLQWASEERLIALEAYDGARFRPWNEWDPPEAVFSSTAAGNQVRVRLLAAGADYAERISERPANELVTTPDLTSPTQRQVPTESVEGAAQMYNQDLGDKVLERVHKSFPRLVALKELRATLPEYSSLPDRDWYLTCEALMQYGLVEGPVLRSGANNEIEDVQGLKLTKLGKSRMDELARFLELGDLRYKQATRGLYDDISEGNTVRVLVGEKFGGWHLVPSQAIPQELASLVIARFGRVRSAFEDGYIGLLESAEGGVTARRARWLNRRLRAILSDEKARASSLLDRLLDSFGVSVSVAGTPLEALQGRCHDMAEALSSRIKIAELSRGLPDSERPATNGGPAEVESRATAVPGLADSRAVGREHRVWVVHGRDEKLRAGIFTFLRALGLKPIEWSEAAALTGKGSPYIGEILDAAFKYAAAVVVVLSPDDEARLRSHLLAEGDMSYEKDLTPQARPNVLFEAGMAFSTHPDNTVLVQFGELRPFSDAAGRHTIRMDNSAEKRQQLAQRLRTAGCPVEQVGTDWLREGELSMASPNRHTPSSAKVSTPRSDTHLLGATIVTITPISRTTTKKDYPLTKVDDFGVVIRLDSGTDVRIPRDDYVESWNDLHNCPEFHLKRKFFQGYFPGCESAEEFFLPR